MAEKPTTPEPKRAAGFSSASRTLLIRVALLGVAFTLVGYYLHEKSIADQRNDLIIGRSPWLTEISPLMILSYLAAARFPTMRRCLG